MFNLKLKKDIYFDDGAPYTRARAFENFSGWVLHVSDGKGYQLWLAEQTLDKILELVILPEYQIIQDDLGISHLFPN
ncbi:hypothetical protein LCGC14_3104280 [marine sediment metagenome]|uniref:Uncharacterized protein n=1 Tax=marine sediment metagenome TaxID=412755 RepID=A0A0F8YED8_9ZZZZ